jgi:hypothetical protein
MILSQERPDWIAVATAVRTAELNGLGARSSPNVESVTPAPINYVAVALWLWLCGYGYESILKAIFTLKAA